VALKAKKPELISKRLKMLVYGPAGVGKTTAAIQFPKPYLIDTERGAENESYVKALENAGGVYMFTNDPDELIGEVRSLISEKHPYRTLVIDPLTTIYNDLLDKSAAALISREDPTGTAFSRHKGNADRKIKHLLGLLTRLDMSLIVTSHSKTKWERDGKTIIETGQTFDCYGKLDYLFDLVIEVQKRGVERVGIVKKTRITAFPEGEIFPFSYDEISTRYGKALLEKDAAPVALATPEQVVHLRLLLSDRADKEELVEAWLKKAGADELSEIPSTAADKCIAWLTTQKETVAA
jgi:hypothetical protein